LCRGFSLSIRVNHCQNFFASFAFFAVHSALETIHLQPETKSVSRPYEEILDDATLPRSAPGTAISACRSRICSDN